jgi:hypothetical protein
MLASPKHQSIQAELKKPFGFLIIYDILYYIILGKSLRQSAMKKQAEMKFKRYLFGTNPDLLPVSVPFWPDNGDELCKIVGEHPDDEKLLFYELTKDWKNHSRGSIVLGGYFLKGHLFYVFD